MSDKFLDEFLAKYDVPEEKKKPSQLEAAARGGVQGLTLDFADEITGGAKAGIGKISGEEEALAELYKKYRDDERAKYAAAKDAHPMTYTGANIAGSVASSAVLPGGTLAKAALQGGAAGLGASESDDALGDLENMAIGAAGGAITHGAAGAVKKMGQGSTMRAVGLNADDIGRIEGDVGLEEAARIIRETGGVNPLISEEQIVERLMKAKNAAAASKNAALSKASGEVDLARIMDNALTRADELPQYSSIEKKAVEALKNEIGLQPTKVSSLVEADKVKQSLQDVAFDNTPAAIAKNRHTERALKETAGQVRDMVAEMAPDVVEPNKMYSILRPAAEKASELRLKNIATPMTPTSLAGASKMLRTPARKVDQVISVSSERVSQLLDRSPQLLGKFGAALNDARSRGQSSYDATVHVLNQDPEFRQLMGEITEE